MFRKLTSPESAEPANDSAKSPGEPQVCLEIRRGRTKFPLRPVLEDRFLIGAGANCQLRLGGSLMPPLHSILLIDGPNVWLDALVDAPPLKVNGEIEHSVRVHDGDSIEIGPIQFVIRRTEAELDPRMPLPPRDEESRDLEFDERDMAEMSAADLVELIELEGRNVERFEQGRRGGAEALLHAALLRAEAEVDDASAETHDVLLKMPALDDPGRQDVVSAETGASQSELKLLEEIDEAVKQLHNYSAELDRRAEMLSQREATYIEASTTLSDAQQSLAMQLERLLEHLTARESDRPKRLSA